MHLCFEQMYRIVLFINKKALPDTSFPEEEKEFPNPQYERRCNNYDYKVKRA